MKNSDMEKLSQTVCPRGWKTSQQWNQLLYYVPTGTKGAKVHAYTFGQTSTIFYSPTQVVYNPALAITQLGKTKSALMCTRLKAKVADLSHKLQDCTDWITSLEENLVSATPARQEMINQDIQDALSLQDSLEAKSQQASRELAVWTNYFNENWG